MAAGLGGQRQPSPMALAKTEEGCSPRIRGVQIPLPSPVPIPCLSCAGH